MSLKYRKEFDIIKKPETNRIVRNTVIPSYGKFEVHNTKFNKLISYITENSKKYNQKISNPTTSQKALSNILNQQLELYRLKVLYDNYVRISNENDKKSALSELLLYFSGFRNFCGPGTDIYKQIKNDFDNPSEMFNIDKICVLHDILFTHAKTFEDQQRADEIFISQVIEKYIFNPDKSMFGKNPRSYETNEEKIQTILGYMMSGIESFVSASVIYSGFKIISGAGKSLYQAISNPITTMEAAARVGDTAIGSISMIGSTINYLMKRPNKYVPPQIRAPHKYALAAISNIGMNIFDTMKFLYQSINPEIYKFITTAGFTTLIKDKILAVGALVGILSKYSFENIIMKVASPELKEYFEKNGIMISIVSDEVSEDDLTNLIKLYEAIQNEILKESNLDPIKPIVEADYMNINLESNPEVLINDFKNIVMMQSDNINTKFIRYEETQPPIITDEEYKQAKYIYDKTLSNPEEVANQLIKTSEEISPSPVETKPDISPSPIETKPEPEQANIDELINEFFD